MPTIQIRVLDAFRSLDIENPQLEHHLENDLSMDSQEVISLVVQLEKEFGISLSLDDINRNMSVSQVVEFIEKNYGVA